MITIERLGEVIRKFEAIIDMETSFIKRASMSKFLDDMKTDYKKISEENIPCPKDMEADLEKFFTKIENMYEKTVAN